LWAESRKTSLQPRAFLRTLSIYCPYLLTEGFTNRGLMSRTVWPSRRNSRPGLRTPTRLNIDIEKFASRLRILRAGRSLRDFAEEIGVSAPTVQNYERGRLPEAEVLYRIAVIHGVTMEWLLMGEEHHREQISTEAQIYFQ